MLIIFREEKKFYSLIDTNVIPKTLEDRLICTIPDGANFNMETVAYNDMVLEAVNESLPDMQQFYQRPKSEDTDEAEAILVDVNNDGLLEMCQNVFVTVKETFECFDHSIDDALGSRRDIMEYIRGYAEMHYVRNIKKMASSY